ncbi:hypothetical protein F511_29747 [Dorcoceras hygrometricum]|uniref:Dystroglycan-like n=1 Tax=Dorcoceras hygrometricum TaxID=472368 RepID=A0A2Z7CHD3_9LAMI|nr:hypothetical protein F511_29747 [Dorcoceras hygrometricum]
MNVWRPNGFWLIRFLGCPAVLYEDALTEFFLNGSVRDGKVVSIIRGKQVEISEELFASTFELPVDGLTDLSEIPKDIVFDARSIFSFSGEQVSTSGKKREMIFEFRLLSDILAKTISVKSGSFDVVTQGRFLMMAAITCGVAINWNRLLFNILKDMVTAGSRQAKGYAIQISLLLENVPNLELGDSLEFPCSKVLTKKTVHRYIAVNDRVGVEEVTDVPRVKQTPVKKAVSRKRPATVDEPIVKKKRTRVGKAATVATDSALEAVPVQVVAPISTVPPLAPKRKIQKRRRNNEKVIAETAQVETDVGRTNDSGPDVEDQGVKISDETELWFNLSYEEFATREANRPVETASDTEEGFVTEKVTAIDVGVQTKTGSNIYLVETPSEQTELFQGTETAIAAPTADKNISDDESMTLDAILSTISYDISLPSTFGEITPILFGKSISILGVDEGDWYKASFPKINPADKWKAPLQERDPVKGTVKEQFLLIIADIELLLQSRERVIDEVDRFINSFSLKNLANLKIEDIYEKEGQVLSWAETDSTRIALQRKMYILTKYREFLLRNLLEIRLSNFFPGVATSIVDMKVLDMLSNLHLFVIDEQKVLSQAHSLRWDKPCCSTVFEGLIRDRGAVIARSNTNIKSTCWIKTMLVLMELGLLNPVLITGSRYQEAYRAFLTNIRKDMHDHMTSLSLDVVKSQQRISTQVAAAAFDTVDVRKEVKELNAKVTDLDGHVATIRSELLDFRAKAEENHLNLSTQLGFLVDYIRRGDAKKGCKYSAVGQLFRFEEQRVEMPVDPVDQIIEQVIAETAQVETDVGRTNDSGPDDEDQVVKIADETELWFNLYYEEFATREANRPVETASDTEEEFVTEKVTATDVGVQTETGSDIYLVETPSDQTVLFQGTETAISAPTAEKNISDDESMTLDAILSTIF